MIGFSMEDLLGVLAKIMNAFKQIMKWLGILVLPEDEDKKYYPGASTEQDQSDSDQG